MENDKTLHNWINKTIEEEELKDFKKRPEYDELNELWETTEGMQAPGFDKETMLKEILATPKSDEQIETKTRRLPIWLPLLAAASLIAVLTFLFYPRNNVVELATLVNEEQSKELPDGSKLMLYENSKLNYDANDWSKARQLHLTGSAKFEVVKGKPFTVLTDNGQVEVLGTIFTAKTDGGNLEVACTEGKVRVANIDKSLSDEIEQNETLTVVNNKSMQVNLANEIIFREYPLKAILLKLEKQYKTSFKVNNKDLDEIITVKVQKKNISSSLVEALHKLNIKCDVI